MNKGLIIDIMRNATTSHILAGSAIICRVGADGRPAHCDGGLIETWFEGNLHGVVNLNRYFEKIRCAAGRMVSNYPTAARIAVTPGEVRVLAEYDLRRNFVTRILDEARWRQMLDHPAQTYLAPPPPERDVTDKARIAAALNKVGFRHLTLLARPGNAPFAFQMHDGRIVFARSGEDMQMFWPNDPRIEQLRDLMDPVDYIRIEPELADAG